MLWARFLWVFVCLVLCMGGQSFFMYRVLREIVLIRRNEIENHISTSGLKSELITRLDQAMRGDGSIAPCTNDSGGITLQPHTWRSCVRREACALVDFPERAHGRRAASVPELGS